MSFYAMNSSLIPQDPVFHLFPQLPRELRDLIWKHCIFPRILHGKEIRLPGFTAFHIKELTTDHISTYTPSILHTCQESREIGLEHYQLVPKFECSIQLGDLRKIYVNWDIDNLLCCWFPGPGSEAQWFDPVGTFSRSLFPHIKHLTLSMDLFAPKQLPLRYGFPTPPREKLTTLFPNLETVSTPYVGPNLIQNPDKKLRIVIQKVFMSNNQFQPYMGKLRRMIEQVDPGRDAGILLREIAKVATMLSRNIPWPRLTNAFGREGWTPNKPGERREVLISSWDGPVEFRLVWLETVDLTGSDGISMEDLKLLQANESVVKWDWYRACMLRHRWLNPDL